MQFQHGAFTKADNGSLILTPIAVDGRQLLSTPCKYKNSIYTRWNVTEMFQVRAPLGIHGIKPQLTRHSILVHQRYEIYTDPYNKILRLDMFGFDGTPMNPMYLAGTPPVMQPTTTMNPLPTATKAKSSKDSGKAKRSSEDSEVPFNRNAIRQRKELIDAEKWWWIGVGMTALGSVGYLCS
jgi:hypothetical protein